MLPARMLTGSTTPERRMNSEPWLMPICFSPVTTRLPFGSTSITVTVMLPVNRLLLRSNRPCRRSRSWSRRRARRPAATCRAGSAPSAPLARPTRCGWRSCSPSCSPAVFSLMLMVSVSPTLRATRSSNSGRYALTWKIAPSLGGGGGVAAGRAEIGCCTSTLRSGLPVQPARAAATRAAMHARTIVAMNPAVTGQTCDSRCSIWSDVCIALELIS